MPSTINADTGSLTGTTGVVLTADSSGNLAFQASSVNGVTINQTQAAVFTSTGAIKIPVGTTAQRPSPAVNGMMRYNTTLSRVEGYANNTWVSFL